ncbi:DUF4911 domain-containing protein [Mariprofundus erugo]|uniref:DUF4911 domain-containing protein n=1 Tax=Mariprofundus erugo TaxID=2528639 RepID=UPI0010FE1CFD|nr:DUF4911 domain-containing protein [Mariprofundus erugo]TLS76664.1 DUF4911 domain-containing protein [Mariprofundus erugo]
MSDIDQVLIIELEIPQQQQILLQSILQGEDGLGVVRSFDRVSGRQQFWTTPDQREEAYAWLDSLPEAIGCRITGEWLWQKPADPQ